MRAPIAALLALTVAAVLGASSASAAEGEWRSEQPVAAGIGVPAPLGEVGDITCRSGEPNRCLLITAGTGDQSMPSGIYAFDGIGWYLYSSVCGGHKGRIAWAGPDEFWTVSDYATKQEGFTEAENRGELQRRTLCHFKDGEVVSSYAERFGSAETYAQMNAAACATPADCWFAGERLPGTAANAGAFHLRWDGASLTALPSFTQSQPEIADLGGSVVDLAFHQGRLVESASQAPFLREIVPGDPEVFHPLSAPATSGGAFELSSDGDHLWAVNGGGTAMLLGLSGFETVALEHGPGFTVGALAAEPSGDAAWVGGAGPGSTALLARIQANGTVGTPTSLPAASDEIGPKGAARAITCPTQGQCWMVTGKGWLFHFGGPVPQNTDPALHALITFRPPDNSTPSITVVGVPEDNSGEEKEAGPPAEEVLEEKLPHRRKPRALVVGVHQSILHDTILQLSFTLRAKAHVRLLAKRHGAVVAKTARLTLSKGRHMLRLKLDPDRWPTALDLQAHAVARRQG